MNTRTNPNTAVAVDARGNTVKRAARRQTDLATAIGGQGWSISRIVIILVLFVALALTLSANFEPSGIIDPCAIGLAVLPVIALVVKGVRRVS